MPADDAPVATLTVGELRQLIRDELARVDLREPMDPTRVARAMSRIEASTKKQGDRT